MTPANLQNALIKRIKDALKEFPLRTTYNNPEPFKVYKQKVPESYSDEFDYSGEGKDNADYPFVTVKLAEGVKGECGGLQVTTIVLMVGVKNEDESGVGFEDALAAIEAILGDLNTNPIVDKKHTLTYPISWSVPEEDYHPYYFIGAELKFESMTLNELHPQNHI